MHKFYQYIKKSEQTQSEDWKKKVTKAKLEQLSTLTENTRSWQEWETN